MSILARAQPDLLAFETIPSQKEGEALAQLLKEFPNLKAWLSFNCQVFIYVSLIASEGKTNHRSLMKKEQIHDFFLCENDEMST